MRLDGEFAMIKRYDDLTKLLALCKAVAQFPAKEAPWEVRLDVSTQER
jgi:hypothetical protein